MDAFRNSTGFQRSTSRLRLPTPSDVFSRGKKKRPVISSPIGPVKNSRGPDFTRSDTLIIVPTIKDCSGSEESLSDKENTEARKATRRISASFSTHGSLASPPTVAKSGLIATSSSSLNVNPCSTTKTRIPTTKFHLPTPTTKRTLNPPKLGLTTSFSHQYLSSAAPIKPLPTASSFQSIYEDTSFESTVQDENVPPSDHKASALPKFASQEAAPKNKSRLPKSRTLTVLSDLKTSLSRSSLNKLSGSRDSTDPSSRKTSASSTSILFASTTSRLGLSRSSLVSRSSSSSTSATEVQPDPNQITTSQPSAYWSGRFVSLHDRFLAEEYSDGEATMSDFSPGNLSKYHAITTDRAAVNFRPTHLSHSTTTSALTSLTGTRPRTPSSTKDARCLRIFQHLESLCTTSEAHRSLLAWQQSYARRVGKPQLLPQGGRMEDKSLMGKLFGANPNKGGRRSLPATNESRVPIAKKNPMLAARARGKRVSIN
ncbi:hypothetical protein FBEOM_315 [Fusarium beomiforme]|uniref:Uncharacterized protein n=1 Tax=Fusarium beomiforme TaxID=44412 RepID=A0A9P5E749_9HYPO|nr:hypothetical protein FBEOM_315 [Fusarium beomiforme]